MHPLEEVIATLAKQIATLETRVTLSESAVVILLVAHARNFPGQVKANHAALKHHAEQLLDNMSVIPNSPGDARVAQTVNHFLSSLKAPK